LTGAYAGYHPQTRATRATAISFIALVHVAAVAAVVAAGGAQIVLREAPPLLVSLVSPPPPKPVEVPRPVPMPNLRPPEVHLSIPPPPENLYAVRMEPEVPPSAPALAVAPVASAPPSFAIPHAVVEPPRADMAYLNNPAPTYPAASRRAGEQGKVLLRVRVDAKGDVEEIQLQASSGFARLDEAALSAVRRWRFSPARMGDRAVAGWAIVPVTFARHG
jgi:protein TonB